MRHGGSQGVALAAAVAALSLLVLAPSARAQDRRRCWQLPSGVTLDQAKEQSKAFGRWYELYEQAQQELDRFGKDAGKRAPDPQKVDDVVTKLRIAVDLEAASGPKRTALGPMDYAPYYRLAEALAYQGDFLGARECLDKDLSMVRANPRLSGGVGDLETTIARGFERQEFEIKLAEWNTWAAGDIRACLSDPARSAQVVGAASGDGPLDQRRTAFPPAVITMAGEETARLAGRLNELESDAWRAAVPAGGLGPGSSACAAPAQGTTLVDAERARQGLEACCDAAEQAMRSAGAGACAELARVRGEIRTKQDTLSAYPSAGTGGPLPALPADCSAQSDWTSRDFGELWAGIDALAFPDKSREFGSSLDGVATLLTQAQRGFKTSLTDAVAAIVRADRNCARNLQLGESNATLISLETQLDRAVADPNLVPNEDLRAIPGQVESARSALRARARQGAERLYGNREIDASIDAGAFADLPTARDRFDRTVDQASLDALCAAASKAKGAVDAYWARNLPKLEERVSGTRWVLRAAAGRGVAGSPAGLSCIQEQLDGLPARVTSGSFDRANEAVNGAQSCLADYHARRQEWVDGIRGELKMLGQTVDRLPSDIQGPLAERVATIRDEVSRADTSLGAIGGLFEASSVADDASLRAKLAASNLTVPEARWTDLGALGEDEIDDGLMAVRDEAVDRTLGDAAGVVARHASLADKLGSYVALSVAFEAYGTGDLDGAIESLRAGREAAGADRGAAIRHASLAYFLHTKWAMLGQDSREGPVASLLLADAEQEIRAALRVQQGFELPALLQRGAAFKRYFEGFSTE